VPFVYVVNSIFHNAAVIIQTSIKMLINEKVMVKVT
jgi:hypothetical protein